MHVPEEICVLLLAGFFRYGCTLCSASRAYVLICLICTSYCGQVITLDLSSENVSSDLLQQSDSSSENGKTQSSLYEHIFLRNITSRVWQNTTATVSHRNTGNHGEELTPMEILYDYEVYEDFNLSDVAPEVLVDTEPPEMILSHDQASPVGRRKPVKDGFVWEQKMEILRLHNIYRGNVTPPAADMSFVEWDEELAKVAQNWSNGCLFRHGFPPNSYPGAMGQNLYMGWDPTGVRALLLWYEEYHHYSIKTLECLPAKQCGHYTQMAWGESKLVGCGMKRCGVKKFFVVCHYSPPGNVVGFSPYIIGKPCSQCPLDQGGTCTDNLCVTEGQCTRNPEDCVPECPLECHNCGILNDITCKCTCNAGWDSLDCSRPCTNAHDRCGKNPGWPTVTACSMNNHDVADIYCRKMCGKCRGNELSSEDTCCDNLVCDEGYVIDMKRKPCKCILLCPGPKCHDISHGDSSESEDSGSRCLSKNIYVIVFFLIFLIQRSFITSI